MQNIYRAGLMLGVVALSGWALKSIAAPSSPGSGPHTPVSITEKDGGKVVTVKVGTKINLVLASNASTGYTWVLDKSDGKILPLKGEPEYINSESRAPGSPGRQVWHFQAAKRGKAALTLRYLRPWEKDKEPAKIWKVTVKVIPS